jgi:coatomer protein complex subunit gamma
MSYNKKDEDEGSLLKVDRTSVFQEGVYTAPSPMTCKH